MRLRTSLRFAGLGLPLVTALGCAPLTEGDVGVCGNGVVEAGELCEPEGQSACGDPGQAHECRWTCDLQTDAPCPSEWICGHDGLCRQTDGEFAPAEKLSSDPTSWIGAMDTNADSVPELLALGTHADASELRIFVTDGLGTLVERSTLTMLQRQIGPPVIAEHGGTGWLAARPEEGGSFASFAVHRVVDGLAVPQLFSDGEFTVPRTLIAVPSASGELVVGVSDDGDFDPLGELLPWALQGEPTGVVGSELTAPSVRGWPIDLAHPVASIVDASCPVMMLPRAGESTPLVLNPCDPDGGTAVDVPPLPLGASVIGLAFGDLNGDGVDDYAVQGEAGIVWVAYSVGDGTFHDDPSSIPANDGNGTLRSLGPVAGTLRAVGEYNGDGEPDLVTTASVYLSCPFGVECPSWCVVVTPMIGSDLCPLPISPESAVGDVDGDGRPDLVGQVDERSNLVVTRNLGPQGVLRTTRPMGAPTNVLAVDDFDGDGRDDIVVSIADDSDGTWDVRILFGGSTEDEPLLLAGGFAAVLSAATYRRDGLDEIPRIGVLARRPTDVRDSVFTLGVDVTRASIVENSFEATTIGGDLGSALIGHVDPADPSQPVFVALMGDFGLTAPSRAVVWRASGDDLFAPGTDSATETIDQLPTTWGYNSMSIAVDLGGSAGDEIVSLGSDGVSASSMGSTPSTGGVAVTLAFEGSTPQAPQPRPIFRSALSDLNEVYLRDSVAPQYHPIADPIATYDVDADGDEDVLAIGFVGPAAVFVAWLNEGVGELTGARRSAEFPGPRPTAFAVLGGTAEALDVVVGSSQGDTFRWTVDLDAGTTTSWEPLAGAPPLVNAVQAVDVDGDALADLAFGTPEGLHWMRQLPLRQ